MKLFWIGFAAGAVVTIGAVIGLVALFNHLTDLDYDDERNREYEED